MQPISTRYTNMNWQGRTVYNGHDTHLWACSVLGKCVATIPGANLQHHKTPLQILIDIYARCTVFCLFLEHKCTGMIVHLCNTNRFRNVPSPCSISLLHLLCNYFFSMLSNYVLHDNYAINNVIHSYTQNAGLKCYYFHLFSCWKIENRFPLNANGR